MINLRDLTHFVAIAEHRQIGLAAVQIGLTQPALTKSLQRLEQVLGTPLFVRRRQGLMLTQAGDRLLTRARNLVRTVDDINREITEFADGDSGHLSIGVGPTMMASLLLKITNRILSDSPNVTLKISTALNHALFDMLRRGELDLVVCGLHEETPPDMHQERLMQDEMLVVANRKHPLARKRLVTLQDLSSEKWVLSPHKVLARQWLEDRFRAHSLAGPVVSVEADSALAILLTVAKTNLLGFQPLQNIQNFGLTRDVVCLKAPQAERRRPVGITYMKDAYLSPLAHRLIQTLREGHSWPSTGGSA